MRSIQGTRKFLLAVIGISLSLVPSAAWSAAPSPSVAAPSLVPAETLEGAGATRLTVVPYVDWLVSTTGSLWGATDHGLQQFAGSDGSKRAFVGLPGETCLGMDVGFDSVWVGACRPGAPAIVRIAPDSASIAATIPLPIGDLQYESSVAAGEGSVWAVSVGADKVLVRVDPGSDTAAATYPIEGVTGDLGGVRAGYGGVWVAVPERDTVLRIDPDDGSVAAEIPVGVRPRFMAIGEGSVWAMNEGDGTVSRVDSETDTVDATILVTPSLGIEGGDIAVGGGSVWARVSDQLVARVDPVTNAVVARYGPPAGSGGVAADDVAAWIAAHDVNAIWRLPLR